MGTTFDITKPDVDESIIVDSTLTIPVHVFNRSSANVGFTASLITIPGGATIASAPMTQIGTTHRFTVNLSIPSANVPNNVPAADNMTVQVDAVLSGGSAGESDSNDFKESKGGSGSHGDTFGVSAAALGLEGKAIPVALQLRLDAPVRPGTCSHCDQLNKPMLLVYADHADFAGCWFSQPIDLCADGTAPAFWTLQTKDSKTWTLTLRHNNEQVVAYRYRSAAAKKVPFPMTLRIVGAAGKQCKNWPPSVTIAPAP